LIQNSCQYQSEINAPALKVLNRWEKINDEEKGTNGIWWLDLKTKNHQSIIKEMRRCILSNNAKADNDEENSNNNMDAKDNRIKKDENKKKITQHILLFSIRFKCYNNIKRKTIIFRNYKYHYCTNFDKHK